MEIQLHVPPYIFRYLSTEYGPGPYDIRKAHEIRIAFLHWIFYADAWPPIVETPEASYLIYLYTAGGAEPWVAEAIQAGVPKSRMNFFVAEFWTAAISFVEGFIAGGGKDDRKVALAHFLARYSIDEEVFMLDSAYRTYYRWLERRAACRQLDVEAALLP